MEEKKNAWKFQTWVFGINCQNLCFNNFGKNIVNKFTSNRETDKKSNSRYEIAKWQMLSKEMRSAKKEAKQRQTQRWMDLLSNIEI